MRSKFFLFIFFPLLLSCSTSRFVDYAEVNEAINNLKNKYSTVDNAEIDFVIYDNQFNNGVNYKYESAYDSKNHYLYYYSKDDSQITQTWSFVENKKLCSLIQKKSGATVNKIKKKIDSNFSNTDEYGKNYFFNIINDLLNIIDEEVKQNENDRKLVYYPGSNKYKINIDCKSYNFCCEFQNNQINFCEKKYYDDKHNLSSSFKYEFMYQSFITNVNPNDFIEE